MPLEIFSPDDTKSENGDKKNSITKEKPEQNAVQKEKDMYDCLRSNTCEDARIKLMDCFLKTDRNITPIKETCNPELLKMINCINECASWAGKKK
ncbi:uncharacterized protein CDAR_409321 [Caerostris darwini]|uniref:Uncharacterized protein n=1 Tax=Caerostris darwini TaxID=1538125 RepID=A0AAV4UCU3_9ARAC|nr:uncharacterized protein CDAR_409321 [Caerostris darwini]